MTAQECKARYREKNREKIRTADREYRARNVEKERARVAAWAEANKEKRRAAAAKRYAEKRDYILAQNAAYRAANIEAHRAREKERAATETEKARKTAWSAENKDLQARVRREYKKRNPDKRRADKARRRASEARALPTWANREKIAEFYRTADALGMLTGEWFHVDHVVPLRGRTVCGLHNEFNLQVLPSGENMKKNNRFWPDMPGEGSL